MHTFIVATDTNVSEELRERALKHTAAMLRKIDEVRKQLELPIDQLSIVFETYGMVVHALLAEETRKVNDLIAEEERKKLAERTKRLPITMRSETRDGLPMKIKPGETHEVNVRPQTCTFRPEDLAIHGDRSRWMVHDIKVGNRSQFASWRGPAAGSEFGPGGICEHLRLDTCQTAMDIIVLIIEYVGPEADGEIFEATMVGTATKF